MKPYASWEYVDWKHTLETISLDWKQKKVHWKQSFKIGNKKRTLETILLDWKHKPTCKVVA